jgi:hypothetical protein
MTDVITPYFEIYLQNSDKVTFMIIKVSFTTKSSFYDQRKIYPNNTTELISLCDNNFVVRVCGDVTIKMYNNGMLGSKKLGRISFNTAFLDPNQSEIVFNIQEIDPDKLAKKKYVPKDFQIHVKYINYCNCDNNRFPIQICDMCEDFLKLELQDWKEIEEILKFHEKNIEKSKILLFKNPTEDDCEAVLKSNDNDQCDMINTGIFNLKSEFIDSLNEEKEPERYGFEKKHSDIVKDNKRESIYEKKNSDQTMKDLKRNRMSDSSFENECKII